MKTPLRLFVRSCLAFPFLLLALPAFVSAGVAHGTVTEGLTVHSAVLGRDVSYSVYLPFDYDTSRRAYPVVYLLHGLGDNNTAWVQFGQINMIADEAIAAQQIVPMIIVMPDAGRSWYVNGYDGKVRYEDFFFKEFIPAIESTYRIRADKRYRGIAGLSMGGYGSLVYCFHHPDMFAACAAFSAGIHSSDDLAALPDEGWNSWNNFYGPVFGMDLKGGARLTELWHNNSVLDLAAKLDKDKLSSVRYYLDCGDDDFLYKGNALLHITLRERDIPHEARMRNGGHSWTYWRTGIKDGLAFISESFLQN